MRYKIINNEFVIVNNPEEAFDIECEDMYINYKCNYKIIDGKAVKKTEEDFYPEKLIKAKTKKLQEHKEFLETIIVKINNIPVWFNSDKRGLLINACNNAKIMGFKALEIILTDDILLLPVGELRNQVLNTKFYIAIEDLPLLLAKMDLYAGTVKINEVKNINKINSLTKIEEVENYDFKNGYPETLNLEVNFL